MEPSIQLFLYFLTGITFTFAAVNLIIGFQKGSEKTYLFLGLIGVCVGIYYLLFPIVANGNSSALIILVAFFFFLANFALLPWYFCYYTGYSNKKEQWILTFGMVLTFILLATTNDMIGFRLWNVVGHIVLIGIILFGLKAAFYQKRNGNPWSAWWLIGALILFSILTIDDIIRTHLPQLYPFKIKEDILPFDYFLVLFMILMGLKLARDMQQKYNLEKSMNVKEKRWRNLLEEIELLVVGLNPNGEVNYINPFFMKISKYSENEIIGKNWFEQVLPSSNRNRVYKAFQESLQKDVHTHFQNSIITKEGEELNISWSNVLIEDDDGKIISTLSIGSDITEQELAIKEIESLKIKLEEENILLKAELGKVPIVKKIIGTSDAMRYVLQRALQVAPTDSTVLLEGETGVGKELITNYIQENSERKDKPFIKLNCSAIPATLLESELFGHTKGAYTGADRFKKGFVEMADGGTLFLDEIGEFPLELQPKLLRFLQEGEYQPLGSEVSKKVNVRIIAATNRELLKDIENGRFRNDLYYRLYVYPITIPPLRNRSEDIPELIEMFVKQYSGKHRKSIKKVSKLVVEELKKYHWPGNIRELENIIERAVIVANSDTIKIKDLSPAIANQSKNKTQKPDEITTLESMEKEHILKALKFTKWQVHGKNGAAELLGINPSTLRSRMKKLNITKPL